MTPVHPIIVWTLLVPPHQKGPPENVPRSCSPYSPPTDATPVAAPQTRKGRRLQDLTAGSSQKVQIRLQKLLMWKTRKEKISRGTSGETISRGFTSHDGTPHSHHIVEATWRFCWRTSWSSPGWLWVCPVDVSSRGTGLNTSNPDREPAQLTAGHEVTPRAVPRSWRSLHRVPLDHRSSSVDELDKLPSCSPTEVKSWSTAPPRTETTGVHLNHAS